MTEPSQRTLVRRRRTAAEEVCWMVLAGMATGYFDGIPLAQRDDLGDVMTRWADLAVATGQMEEGTECSGT